MKKTAKKAPEKKPFTFPWRCPKCDAPVGEHGEGDCRWRHGETCGGIVCECIDLEESESPDHGVTLHNPCPSATCYHCGWSGTLPAKPKGLLPREKKALAEGWTPPEKRQRELDESRRTAANRTAWKRVRVTPRPTDRARALSK